VVWFLWLFFVFFFLKKKSSANFITFFSDQLIFQSTFAFFSIGPSKNILTC
jgi:hypothetical protein